ncbi:MULTISPECIES: MATE family efflux transporter [unclassified Polaribacter]|uniref:MATE family efflux transporter n=1 Tax=unclassified Polaribacter TaxID=196858 RepID=UPI0011BF957F|nr:MULTISPECIES: MATE family efflux transporter [unclassified Polaribacter]TXD52450.1 MATE family efflux transporter [Polaribacter sp. IC063]TXD61088.1 MATE family efflux transporter [Polaribacter sp. IC066]
MTADISFKRINKLAIPALIAGIAEPLLSITDTAIIGNIDENATESLAAVGIVGAFISMLIWVFGQVRSAISSIISQYVGAHKLNEIKNLPAQAIAIIVTGSVFVLAISYPFAENIFQFYNASGNVLAYCVVYFKIRIFGFPFSLLVFAIFGTFRGLQNTFYPMIIAITGATLNIILDIILVYGVEGFIPAMNVEGAAYASVIAQVSMAVISVVLLLKKTTISLNMKLPFHREVPKLLNMIGNLFIRTIALNTALYFATSYAADYGKEYIAAYTIGLNIWLLGAFMVDGYSSAGNILSGKLLGAKEYETLIALSNKLTKYGFITGVLIAGVGFVFYDSIGRVFTKDPLVLEQFYHVFWIVILTQPLNAITFIYDGMFKGMGEMKYLRNVLLLSTGFVFIPTLLFFDWLEYKLVAIWVAFTFWILARGIPLIFKFRNKFLPLVKHKC